jgi:hypothetical protein
MSKRWRKRNREETLMNKNQFHPIICLVSGLWVTAATAPLVTTAQVLGAKRQYFSTDRFKSDWVTNSYRPGSQSNLADTRVPKFTRTPNSTKLKKIKKLLNPLFFLLKFFCLWFLSKQFNTTARDSRGREWQAILHTSDPIPVTASSPFTWISAACFLNEFQWALQSFKPNEKKLIFKKEKSNKN